MKIMKAKIYIPIILIPVLFLVAECSKDFLDRPPEDRLTYDTYFQTNAEVEMSTAALYHVVWHRFNHNVLPTIGDVRAGNMITNDRYIFYWFAVQETRFELLNAWRSLYSVIGHSNIIMSKLKSIDSEEVSDEVIKVAMAECHFMRGVSYMWLTVNWGEVPIIYDVIAQMTDTTIARATKESLWEFIIRDFTYAAKNLPDNPAYEGRVSNWAAKGMLAKAYLFRSGLNSTDGTRNQADLDSAVFYAGDVCENSPYSLVPNYPDLFTTWNDNNEESLFALQWLVVPDIYGVSNDFQAFYARDPDITGTGDGWGIGHGASYNLLQYYVNNPVDSIRRKATFMFPGDHYDELNKADGGYFYDDTTIANVKKYIVGTPEDNPDSEGTPEIMKTSNNTYMLRLAEMYLIYAEAIMGNNDQTTDPAALDYFNRVRSRAGLAGEDNLTFWKIFMEKRIEFAMEGNLWLEFMRWYFFEPEAAKDTLTAQDKGAYYILPHGHDASNNRIWDLQPSDTSGEGTGTPRFFTVTDENIWFPLPESEVVQAPNLKKDPEPFDFSLLGE